MDLARAGRQKVYGDHDRVWPLRGGYKPTLNRRLSLLPHSGCQSARSLSGVGQA